MKKAGVKEPAKEIDGRRKIIISLVFIAVFLLITIAFFLLQIKKPEDPERVSRIIDGDTFVLSSGETVRLLCIDTPEKGQKGYDEAKLYLGTLILNKHVYMEKDITDKDAYGRLLRYVYVDDIFVNRDLLANGYAEFFPYNNTRDCSKVK